MSEATVKLLKLNVTAEATNKLRVLKARTNLTPNILARIGLALSLEEPGRPVPETYPTDGMEFNSYTLLGAYSELIAALLKQRVSDDGYESFDSDTMNGQLRAHVNRGVNLLYPRLKNIEDLAELLPKSD
tara:strand:+ start:260 stop:649 length:390 start_codon:yes stop_codon:yes gene_type:complete